MPLERRPNFLPEHRPPPERESAYVLVPPTNATALLGHPVAEAPGLALGSSPLLLAARRDSSAQTAEFAALLNQPLDSIGLQQLLLTVAPSKPFASSRFAIIADWEMPDLNSPSVQPLQQRHAAGLGAHWQDFNQHRPSLLHTLRHDPDTVRVALTRLWTRPWVREQLLASAITPQLRYGWGFFARDPAAQEFRQALLAAIRTRQEARRKGDQPSLPEAQALGRFQRWHKAARWQLAAAVYAGLPAATQQQLLTDLTRMHGKTLMEEEAEAGAVVYEQDEVQVRSLGSGRVEVRIGQELRAQAQRATDLPWYEAWRVLPETIINRNVLLPLLRWRKDASGRRTWNLERLEPEVVEQLTQQAGQPPPSQEGGVLRWNPVLGPLVVAYLEPELRAGWPEWQSLPGGEYEQPMGPAQVPVLALQHREELLESALLAASERYAEPYLR